MTAGAVLCEKRRPSCAEDREAATQRMKNVRIAAMHSITSVSSILELRNITKQYAGRRVVDGVSLEVPRGAFFSLLGPSGCGKTTTLRMIAGFDEPSQGDILLDGARVNDRRPYERNVSTVFQSY